MQAVVRLGESQDRLNSAIATALESLALQADKYDAEIATLKAEADVLRFEIAELRDYVRGGGGLHSVKV